MEFESEEPPPHAVTASAHATKNPRMQKFNKSGRINISTFYKYFHRQAKHDPSAMNVENYGVKNKYPAQPYFLFTRPLLRENGREPPNERGNSGGE